MPLSYLKDSHLAILQSNKPEIIANNRYFKGKKSTSNLEMPELRGVSLESYKY